jgi:hypothetical protein
MPSDLRAKQNSEFFRDVNDRINLLEAKRLSGDPIGFVCECANLTCRDPVYLTVEEYRAVIAAPGWFVTIPGHVHGQLDRVIVSTPRYAVVEAVDAEVTRGSADPSHSLL